jgi:alpha-aminoadipic semialdehyde synthase
MSVMVNGVYWQPGFPRLLTNEDIQQLTRRKAAHSVSDGCPPLPHRFLAVCDISADINVRIIVLKMSNFDLVSFQIYCVLLSIFLHLLINPSLRVRWSS